MKEGKLLRDKISTKAMNRFGLEIVKFLRSRFWKEMGGGVSNNVRQSLISFWMGVYKVISCTQ